MFKNGSYLRVTTPKTTNGIIPATENGTVLTKETFLPLSAKKKIEAKNARLNRNGFQHLVAKVEVVNGTDPKNAPNPEVEKLKAELEALKAEKKPENKKSEKTQTT